MSKYDEFGYEHQTVSAADLQSGDIIIGHLGGISAVEAVYKSHLMNGCSVIDTEHGALYIDSDEPVVIIQRDEPEELPTIKKVVNNRSFTFTVKYDDETGSLGISW